MKLFIAISLLGTALFAAATYRPTEVCMQTHGDTTISCDGNQCTATTFGATLICKPSHQ